MRVKKFRVIIWGIVLLFISMNVVAYIHAYKFTHFSANRIERTKDPKELSFSSKLKILFTGIENPRPKHTAIPSSDFETLYLNGEDTLACWSISVPNSKGTIILFHGYAGEKSSLLGRAYELNSLGFTTLLVDFNGSGDSNGNTTSIGYHESSQVKIIYDYLLEKGEKQIYLFGTSMGAAAILKAIDEFKIQPKAIILECPFGSLYITVCARFRMMGIPSFPMAGLLTFWRGVQNGYWAFGHNPKEYAKSVKCPTLLLFGEKDDRVSIDETNSIYTNLNGYKVIKNYPNEGHLVFPPENSSLWESDVSDFLNSLRIL